MATIGTLTSQYSWRQTFQYRRGLSLFTPGIGAANLLPWPLATDGRAGQQTVCNETHFPLRNSAGSGSQVMAMTAALAIFVKRY